MRYVTFVLAGLIACALTVQAASSNKPSCKKIRDAVWAGKTLEQITAEFDTDAETVMKCTQKKGKRKAAPKAQKKKAKKGAVKSGEAASGAGTSSPEKAKSPASSSRKPSAPRSGGRSEYHQP